MGAGKQRKPTKLSHASAGGGEGGERHKNVMTLRWGVAGGIEHSFPFLEGESGWGHKSRNRGQDKVGVTIRVTKDGKKNRITVPK